MHTSFHMTKSNGGEGVISKSRQKNFGQLRTPVLLHTISIYQHNDHHTLVCMYTGECGRVMRTLFVYLHGTQRERVNEAGSTLEAINASFDPAPFLTEAVVS